MTDSLPNGTSEGGGISLFLQAQTVSIEHQMTSQALLLIFLHPLGPAVSLLEWLQVSFLSFNIRRLR